MLLEVQRELPLAGSLHRVEFPLQPETLSPLVPCSWPIAKMYGAMFFTPAANLSGLSDPYMRDCI